MGLQAQNTLPPYLALWSRLKTFDAKQLSTLIRTHRVARLALMRSTIHLVTARDCLRIRPLLQPMIEHHFHTGSPFGRKLAGLDFAQLAAEARKLMPRSTSEAGKLLKAKFPRYDAESLGNAARTYLALIQLPPRGIWGEGGMPICDTAEHLLGKPQKPTTVDALILRYLAAFGPASPRDFTAWSGMRGSSFDGVKKKLVGFKDDAGRELFDLPDAPRPDEDVEAPPRFLGEYDNLALAHDDRRRVIAEADRKRTFSVETGVRCFALIDGFVGATWKTEKGCLRVEPFRKISRPQRVALEEEAHRLEAFLHL